jgi:FtsH-binding integral membrane protein
MSQTYYGDQVSRPVSIGVSTRETFIARTYTHLLGAIALFLAIEVALFQSGLAVSLARGMLSVNWLLVLGAFVIVSWLASSVAATAASLPAQYAALGGFVAAEAVIFVPMLYIANAVAPGAIQSAGLLTAIGFAGLTAIAFATRKDFSFLGGLLRWAFVVALLAIVGAVLFGFQLGTWFSVAMVGLAGAAILHDTSNVMLRFPEDRYVASALQLFASVALLFWYLLRLVMGERR